MHKKPDDQLSLDDFVLPFEGKLRADNRWVRVAKIIPWTRIETDYAKYCPNNIGQVAKPARMALAGSTGNLSIPPYQCNLYSGYAFLAIALVRGGVAITIGGSLFFQRYA